MQETGFFLKPENRGFSVPGPKHPDLSLPKPEKWGAEVGFGVFPCNLFQKLSFFSPNSFRSPLEGSLNMKLSAHTESNSTAKGFLTYFTEVNGYGDWHRRWCVLKDLTLYFWKYPEDEQKRKAPIEVSSKFRSCLGTVSLLRQQK